MESFIIEGGHPLKGEIIPQGAKNEALEVICAALLTSEPVEINNIPDILDVNNLIQLLRDINVKVTRTSRNNWIRLFTSRMSGMLEISTGSRVSRVAQITSSASFLAP